MCDCSGKQCCGKDGSAIMLLSKYKANISRKGPSSKLATTGHGNPHRTS